MAEIHEVLRLVVMVDVIEDGKFVPQKGRQANHAWVATGEHKTLTPEAVAEALPLLMGAVGFKDG